MQIKSNTLLKVMVPLALFIAIAIGVKSCGTQSSTSPSASKPNTISDLTPEELQILGIEGDTPDDTLRTLVGRLRVIQDKQEALERKNVSLSEENASLKRNGENVDSRIRDAVNTAKQEEQQAWGKLQAEQQRLANLFEGLKNGSGSQSTASPAQQGDLPIGLGLESDGNSAGIVSGGVIWVEPQDAVQLDRNGKPLVGAAVNGSATGSFQFPSSFASLNDNEITRQKAELDRAAKNQQAIEEATPVYTLPENATLVGSRGMTALLGRVPIDGKVTDPYPFKVLIGKENLTANGIELPDVEGAVVSGTATGDWVLSCVRGEVHSITFVFTDGTVRTVPSPAKNSDGSNGKSNGGSIGWLSDENGIPCLSGERKSNASTYLPTLFALSGAGAAADAMANNQTTTSIDGTTVTSTLTGSAGQAALGKALSGGTSELASWVKARYGQMFDAVYVPPGARVAVHITRQIPIDYEEQGRKVRYDVAISQPHGLD
ncbi:TIGR03752 family integrating conjugative element protein [Enterobacteriaceae bacterium YMB-R22]|jgi:integrating conjugative element protein (TIGR03752 family)|uniref:TIGR03752 family integrating conjugative element protein n=1 Tax=Tenebrionicola larvae TaxID=2815733 RepID=UPI002010CD0B|nr:TIGR03752 family integrating conjugative element protein [Tenebrionicola larvae]MBV4413524.1 TIGR03752 family integrating conjugative element protein [Tenebrionicola larvae]